MRYRKKLGCYIYLKFLVKLGKMESLHLLTDIYGDAIMSQACVFEWHKQFFENCIEVEDKCVIYPCFSNTDNNILKINDIV